MGFLESKNFKSLDSLSNTCQPIRYSGFENVSEMHTFAIRAKTWPSWCALVVFIFTFLSLSVSQVMSPLGVEGVFYLPPRHCSAVVVPLCLCLYVCVCGSVWANLSVRTCVCMCMCVWEMIKGNLFLTLVLYSLLDTSRQKTSCRVCVKGNKCACVRTRLFLTLSRDVEWASKILSLCCGEKLYYSDTLRYTETHYDTLHQISSLWHSSTQQHSKSLDSNTASPSPSPVPTCVRTHTTQQHPRLCVRQHECMCKNAF